MNTLDFSKPVTFRIAELMLEKQEFTQLELSKELKVSVGQVNKVTKALENAGAVAKKGKEFCIERPLLVMDKISFFRKMKHILAAKVKVGGEPRNLLNIVHERPVACLETALNLYGENIVSKRACYYVKSRAEAEKISAELKPFSGTGIEMQFYAIDVPFLPVEMFGTNATPFARTLVDLACDNSVFVAHNAVNRKWGKRII